MPGLKTTGVTLSGHTDWILTLGFSPDGRWLASAGKDNVIRIWKVGDWRLAGQLEHHSDAVMVLAFSGDGRYLASGSYDRTACVWDLDTLLLRQAFTEHMAEVSSAAFSPNAELLAAGTGSNDNMVKLWDCKTGSCLKELTGHHNEGYFNKVRAIAFSPDGTRVASMGEMLGEMMLWDVKTGECLRVVKDLKPEGASVFSHDISRLTLAAYGRGGHWVRQMDLTSGNERWCSSESESFMILAVAQSGDNRWVASGGYSGQVKLRHNGTGQLAQEVTGHQGKVFAVAFSADSRWLASGGEDKKIKVWEIHG